MVKEMAVSDEKIGMASTLNEWVVKNFRTQGETYFKEVVLKKTQFEELLSERDMLDVTFREVALVINPNRNKRKSININNTIKSLRSARSTLGVGRQIDFKLGIWRFTRDDLINVVIATRSLLWFYNNVHNNFSEPWEWDPERLEERYPAAFLKRTQNNTH